MSGLGGDGFYQVYDQATGRAVVFNGSGPAPAAATPERYAGGIPRIGPLRSRSPACSPGLRHDASALSADCPGASSSPRRSPLRATALPSPLITSHLRREYRATLRSRPAQRRNFPDQRRCAAGRCAIVQNDLARTLEEIASEGAETFYRGSAWRGGWCEVSRLPEPWYRRSISPTSTPKRQEPIAIDYRGFTVLEAPPNSTGFVLLEELKILENFDLAANGSIICRCSSCHGRGEKACLRRPRAVGRRPAHDRRHHLAELLSADYTARLAASIDMRRAAPTRTAAVAAGDTTYFCTADGEGNAVSGVQSINSGFGSGVIAGDTGILLNNRMSYWHLDPGHPNRLRPGRRVRHTMNPPIVLRDGSLWGVFGTPGADNQVQVNMQILTAMTDFGLDPQQAAEMPRWTSNLPGQYANWPHDGEDALTIERRFSDTVRAELASPRSPGQDGRRSRRTVQR